MNCKFPGVVLLVLCAIIMEASAGTVLVSHEGNDSMIMPSLSPAGENTFNISYIRSPNYHDPSLFGGIGGLWSGTLTLDGEGFTLASVEQINTSPIRVGIGGTHPFSTYMRPFRRDNMIAWSDAQTPTIKYYNFQTATAGTVNWVDGNWGRQINPRVSGQALSYWSRSTDSAKWQLHITSTNPQHKITLAVEDTASPDDPAEDWELWKMFGRTGDIYTNPDGLSGRVVFTSFSHQDGGFVPYVSTFDLRDGMIEEPQPLLAEHIGIGGGMITNLVTSNDYIVWQQSLHAPFAPIDPNTWEDRGPLVIAKWIDPTEDPEHPDFGNPEAQPRFECIGELDLGAQQALMQEPALFGSFLVYADQDGHRLVMRNLDEGLDGEVTVLVQDDLATLGWPAVWVDEATGEYVVLYQSSHSPADLMVASSSSIPEPASLALMGVGALALLRRQKH